MQVKQQVKAVQVLSWELVLIMDAMVLANWSFPTLRLTGSLMVYFLEKIRRVKLDRIMKILSGSMPTT